MHTVLFIESGVSGGGSFQSLHQLVSGLDRARFAPVVAYVNETEWLERMRGLGVPAHLLFDRVYTKTVPWFVQKRLERMVKAAHRRVPFLADRVLRFCHGPLLKSLARLVREHDVDLIYLNDQIDRDLFGVYAARDAGLPLVSHLRSMNGENMNPARAALANGQVSTYVANSAVTRDYWVGRGLDPDKCLVVHNGVPGDPVEPLDLRQEYGVPEGHQVIGCVARLVPVKNHETLIRAFALLQKKLPETTLILAGDGPLEQRLRTLARESGVVDKVLFPGYEHRARPLMAALDLLVLPSRFDAFGRVLVEGMQAGVPVIGADAGGIPEVVEPGVSGLLVPPDDEAAWAEAMARVLTDPELRERLASGGRKAAAERFSMERMVRAIETVMERALAGRAAPPIQEKSPEPPSE